MPKLLDPGRQITDGTTVLPVVSGKAYFSEPGTTTEKTVYSDDALSAAISQPITLNSEGRFPDPPYGSGEYRLQVYDSTDTGTRDGVLIFDEDNIRGATDFSDITLTAPLKADDSTSTALPVYTFDGDLDTGIAHPAADTIAGVTGGTERWRTNASGNTGFGTTSPAQKVHVLGVARFVQSGGTYTGAQFDLPAQDQGLFYTGTNQTRETVLRARLATGSPQMQMNITGDGWEWGEGSGVDSTPAMSLDTGAGNLTIIGALSKGSGTFRIPHPIRTGHQLVHSFIEGPKADLVYRGRATLQAGAATVDLDADVGMTSGTFAALARNCQVWVQNDSGWDAVRGSVSGGTLAIECQSDTTDEVSWLVIAERQDQTIKDASWTDADGYPVLEPEA